MFTPEEKLTILGSLLHDIGKFQQRCKQEPLNLYHDHFGRELINSKRLQNFFKKILTEEYYPHLLDIVSEHHNATENHLINIVKIADRLSAGENVEFEKKNENKIGWKYKHLESLFTKINLKSELKITPRYYRHKNLEEKDFDIIIPHEFQEEQVKSGDYTYNEDDFNCFLDELEFLLRIYQDEDDFQSVINLLLILFEKWLWCIPDYVGESGTDISLYNHLKDVAAFSHAIYLTQKETLDSTKLNLIIGDIPGIQKYIFDVTNKKPAKILRGRSIFVQILTRNIATLFINRCGLSEASLIMLAGGKFYLLAPDNNSFRNEFSKIQGETDEYLFKNFRMELSFNSIYHQFDYEDLIQKKKTFGQIIEEASFRLLENKYSLYNNRLFSNGNIDYKNYIWKEEYIDGDDTGTDSIKCKVTDKPIRKEEGISREGFIPNENEAPIKVDRQVKNEYDIGNQIIGNNLIIQIENNGLDIRPEKISKIREIKKGVIAQNQKLLLNVNHGKIFSETLLNKFGRDFYLNARTLEVANYCSFVTEKKSVLPFEDMVKEQEGAKFLSFIKGDIDNLGLIMAYGLTKDDYDLFAISQTTTLSSHLKYFFSFFINGFLQKWEVRGLQAAQEKAKNEKPDITNEELKKVLNGNRVYTIFAGGDDLMLVAPQQTAAKLVYEFNKKFMEFICGNDEVHISYSLTNFKDHSPIRIISDIAEQNQKEGKKYNRTKQFAMLENNDKTSFSSRHDKSSTGIFGGIIKNAYLSFFNQYADRLTEWIEQNDLSHGILQKLLDLSEMERKYSETLNASYLISYARTKYAINRIKDLKLEIRAFLNNVLVIHPDYESEAEMIKSILNPLICQVMYNTRYKE